MTQPTPVPVDPKYLAGIREGLDQAFRRAKEQSLDPAGDRIVIFSDHHTGYSATTPARDYALRAKHDRAMYEWARNQAPGVVLIAGHTHRPVFARSVPDPPTTRPIAELKAALKRAGTDRAAAAAIRAELEYARTSVRRPDDAFTVAPPCYFDTGCCAFPDGDVTGLEIADQEIRLVRWSSNIREISQPGAGVDVESRVLAREKLEDIFAAVSKPAPPGAGAVEVAVRPE